ncbi:MAG: hypothetical protein E7306_12645 [Butyrivibrio sp.]|nr:hypothetical protein [Butyrivibrio sp.]
MQNVISLLWGKYKKIPIQAKLTIWTFFGMCMQKAIAIITVPIFTRIMSTEQYGQFSVYMSWMNIFYIITSFRLYAGVYNKGFSKYRNDRAGFTLSMQYTTTIITIIVFAIYLIFHKQINAMTELPTFVMVLMFAELLVTPSVPFWTVSQRYEFKYKSVLLATLILAISNPCIGIIAVLSTDNKGIARITSEAAVQVVFGLVFYLINLFKGKFKFKVEYALYAVKFNIPLIPHYFSEYILNQSDRIMIQKLVGLSEAGIYAVAYSAGMLLTIVSSSINQALVPWLYQQLDEKKYEGIQKIIVSLGFMILVPISMFMALSPEIVSVLAGPEYHEAVRVIAPITSSIVFMFLFILFANIELYYDNNKFTMYISMIGAILNIVLNYIFINLLGFWAAGFTTFFCYGVYCIGHYAFMEHIFFKNEGRHLIKSKWIIFITSILTGVMILFYNLNDYAIIRFTLLGASFVAAFVMRDKIISVYSNVLKKKK